MLLKNEVLFGQKLVLPMTSLPPKYRVSKYLPHRDVTYSQI